MPLGIVSAAPPPGPGRGMRASPLRRTRHTYELRVVEIAPASVGALSFGGGSLGWTFPKVSVPPPT
jgi:hypothetical protein